MRERTIFFEGSPKPLISLAATLCLASVMLMSTGSVYARAQLAVKITSLGDFQCAQVLFEGKPFTNNEGPQTVTRNEIGTNNDTIRGEVTGNGMFSVNFYRTSDCSGKRGNFARFATTTNATFNCDARQKTLCQKR